ncbi:MAG: cytochrome b [Devosia sp.]|nr:cytochrome b [Devosia sp.]
MAKPTGYSRLQIFLHWSIAALVVFQLFFNQAMQHAFSNRLDGERLEQFDGALLHMIAGLTILALAIVRVTIRTTRGTPPAHKNIPAILNWLAHGTHMLLYGFIFAMPLTGAAAWFLGLEFAAELHEIGRLVLVPVIGFHVLGALAEHFVFRNNSLKRMLRATD